MLATSAGFAAPPGPAPGPVPPNASRVTAKVIAHKVWPPGSLKNVRPSIPADQTLYSLQVEIVSSEPHTPTLGHLVERGRKLEVFSSGELPADLPGKTIQATLKLTGDTDGSRWLIENIHKIPAPTPP